jgi:hypothetical protein
LAIEALTRHEACGDPADSDWFSSASQSKIVRRPSRAAYLRLSDATRAARR